MSLPNPRATFLGPVQRTVVQAPDDLLTAGLGPEGLRGPAPAFADPAQPTPAELRRRAVYINYRSLVDVSEAGGFGRLFGVRSGRRVGGVEYLVALAGPDGRGRHTALLQIPEGFDPRKGGLVAAAASGSRGLHGALPIAGAWALAHGHALVLSDKGTGMGLYDVDRGLAVRVDGTLTERLDDPWVTFAPPVAGLDLPPHTVLFRHAEGGNNPEREWGDYLLQAIDAALQLLRQEYPHDRAGHGFAPGDLRILAVGISNAGATVLRALERDHERWISGAVVSEPNVVIDGLTAGLEVASHGRVLQAPGRSLLDYGTQHFLLQPCAVLTDLPGDAPFADSLGAVRPLLGAWCEAMGQLGVLPAGSEKQVAVAARKALLDSGIRPEALEQGAFNLAATLWPALAYSYAMAYARVTPGESLLDVRFAATDAKGVPRALTLGELARAMPDGSGISPTLGINAIAPLAPGLPPSMANGGSVPLALAFRGLVDAALPGDAGLRARVQQGIREATMTARLDDRPVLVFHGRADGLIPVNHTSRPYYAAALRGGATGLRYYEVQHGQHFDGFLALPGFQQRYVPLQGHVEDGLSRLVAALEGAGLPPSQVVRSQPRAPGAPLEAGADGRLLANPGADTITFDGQRLSVPE